MPGLPSPVRRAVVALLAGLLAASAACTPAPEPAPKPNIVMVLTDDLSSDLLRFMPQVQRMEREGVRFTDYSVANTLCCPSRASILTGRYPHNTGVLTNAGPHGGFPTFHRRGGERSTIGTQLRAAGYRTAFMGKYLNGYRPEITVDGRPHYVPPGWDVWAGAENGHYGNAYEQYGYQLNENGRLAYYGHEPSDYLTDVLTGHGTDFVRSSAAKGRPFYLQLNTISPHWPAPAAPRHEGRFAELTAPRGPAFDESDLGDKARWLRGQSALSADEKATLDRNYRKRARSMLAVDDMLTRLRATLEETGQGDNTYVVFTSDNGFHMGEHRLLEGKQTAFDTDVVVPLVVTGPGVPAGRAVTGQAQSVDLRPTFADLAGAKADRSVDGSSLAAAWHGDGRPRRAAALIEHHGPNYARHDPDRQRKAQGNPPSYAAIRTAEGTYVEYDNGDREYYDRRTDPHQLTNTYAELGARERDRLHATLERLRQCDGARECAASGGLA